MTSNLDLRTLQNIFPSPTEKEIRDFMRKHEMVQCPGVRIKLTIRECLRRQKRSKQRQTGHGDFSPAIENAILSCRGCKKGERIRNEKRKK